MPKVFVYGTLKSGFHNHFLLEGCEFEEAEASGYDLHASASLPFVIEGTGIVKGELYQISKEILKRLDRLEDHPNFYIRRIIYVKTLRKMKIAAWVYLYPQARRFPKIDNGVWIN